MRYSTVLVRGLFVLSTILMPVSESYAVFDQFNPYVYSEVLYDSNYYRDSDDAESERVWHLGAGLFADLKLSRQHFLLDVSFDQAKHDSFNELDHIQVNAIGTWDWQVGNRWSGNLGQKYSRELSSFDEQTIQQKDMRTTRTSFFDAGYQVLPDWFLKGGVRFEEVSYQHQNAIERDTVSRQFEMQYQNTLNTKVGMRFRYATHDLPDRFNDYYEREFSGVFYWQGSAKSSLSANLGFTDVIYNELDGKDFSGTTGRLTYHWALTGKTYLNISVWQETSSLNEEVDSYVLTKGISINPTWSVTNKVNIFGEISKSDNEFKGQEVLPGESERKDDTLSYRMGIGWNPLDYIQLSFSYTSEKRNSNINTFDYDSNQVLARAQVIF